MTLHHACERVIDSDDLAICDCDLSAFEPPLITQEINDVLDAACDALAIISGFPVGRCTTTYRPCQRGCGCQWGCGCGLQGIKLPGIAPTVTGVKIDGVAINSSEYRLYRDATGSTYLERYDPVTGSRRSWPRSQRLGLPDTAADTFSITVEAGEAADQVMKNAAAEIACDIFTGMRTERERSPEGMVSASVYGVFMDLRRFGELGREDQMRLAGLTWVQRFIASRGGRSQTAILSQDQLNGWELYEAA